MSSPISAPISGDNCVMIMAGGTGGHIYPALAVAKQLQQRDVRTVWLGSRVGLENTIVPQHGIKLIPIFVSGLRGKGLLRRITAPMLLFIALLQSILALIRERPGAVLGMGGFASGPGGVAAWLCRIPLIIHEQNARAGLTNAWLSKIATTVFQAFPNTFENTKAKTVGNPVREEICELPEPQARQRDDQEFRILIVGGSRGAHALNHLVPEALGQINTPRLKIWHQTGPNDLVVTREQYSALQFDAKVDAYIEDMASAYTWADILICRAGAMTVSEIMAVGVTALLVPFPYATDDHQTLNAQYLTSQNAALLLPEGPDLIRQLTGHLKRLMADRSANLEIAVRARSLAITDAAERVSDQCYEISNG